MYRLALTLAICLGLGACPAAQYSSPDLILLNGKIITMDDADTIATAVAITGSSIVAVGSSAQLAGLAGEQTEIIDLDGKAVTPGLIDTHNHFAWGAADALFTIDLVYPAVLDIDGIRDLVAGAAAGRESGEWIIGSGWDAGKLAERRTLTRGDLDDISPNNPVWLGHTSGHFGIANSAALKLAGISVETPDPEGGFIERDAQGQPTGILTDQAQDIIYEVIPPYTVAQFADAVAKMTPKLNADGITTIKDPEIRQPMWDGYQRAKEDGDLTLRVFTLWRSPDTIDDARDLLERIGATTIPGDESHDDHLISGGVKIYVDGSGTVRTAWMHDEWNMHFDQVDDGNFGFPVVDTEILRAQIDMFHEAGIHLGVHAIGDRAIDWIMDTYDEILTRTPTHGLRHSIIHCNIPSDRALDLMVRLQSEYDAGYPETQPGFLWWIGDAYAANFGPARNPRMIPLGTFIEKGIIWGSSSDYNVTPFAPRHGIWASVAREALLGTHGSFPYGRDESISVTDALRAYTRWNARQVFMEDKIGRIESGKYADIVVWDRDPLTVPTADLQGMRALMTFVGGELVHSAEEPQ